jgi:NADH-quinone oxidoreductase subunit D
VSGFANEIPFMVATERLMGIEAPERAQSIRLILTEMARISSHLLFLSSFPLELGAATPLMYALRERERVLDLIEGLTGGRFHPNFNRIGGVKPVSGAGSTQKKALQDLPKGFLGQTRDAMEHVRSVCDEMVELVLGNEIFQERTRGVGIIPADKALAFGVTGPNLRASGVQFDLRTTTSRIRGSISMLSPARTAMGSIGTRCVLRRSFRPPGSWIRRSTRFRPETFRPRFRA